MPAPHGTQRCMRPPHGMGCKQRAALPGSPMPGLPPWGALQGTKYGGECGVVYESLYRMPGTTHEKQWTSYDQGPLHIVVLSSGAEGCPALPCTTPAGAAPRENACAQG